MAGRRRVARHIRPIKLETFGLAGTIEPNESSLETLQMRRNVKPAVLVLIVVLLRDDAPTSASPSPASRRCADESGSRARRLVDCDGSGKRQRTHTLRR